MELMSLADLLDVQELDLQIDRLLEQRQNLPELKTYKATHEQINTLEQTRGEEAKELRDLELTLDKSEGELELLEIKLDEHETRLFAGGMSARETEHMRLEVQSLKGQRLICATPAAETWRRRSFSCSMASIRCESRWIGSKMRSAH